jgi:hypothetical protein
MRERAGKAAGHTPCGRAMAGVEGGLAAADLSAGELDLAAGGDEKRPGVGDCLGEDEVAEAGGEQLHPHARVR